MFDCCTDDAREDVLAYFEQLASDIVNHVDEEGVYFVLAPETNVTLSDGEPTMTHRVEFSQSVPREDRFVDIVYTCQQAMVEQISPHYVLISGQFTVTDTGTGESSMKSLKKIRKKINAARLTIEPAL